MEIDDPFFVNKGAGETLFLLFKEKQFPMIVSFKVNYLYIILLFQFVVSRLNSLEARKELIFAYRVLGICDVVKTHYLT